MTSRAHKFMLCHLAKLKSASSLEEQRFCALTLWANKYPDFVWKKDVTSHIDSLLETARTYKPKVQFVYSSIQTEKSMIKLNLMNSNFSSKVVNEQKFAAVCFDSKALRIDCQWSSSNSLLWEWANFTFKFDESTSRAIIARMSTFDENPFETQTISNKFVCFFKLLFLISLLYYNFYLF